MNAYHLSKILKHGMNNPILETAFKRMYEPEYYSFQFDESKLKSNTNFLVFNFKSFDFYFVSGVISCTGVEIKFKSLKYDNILVNVGYDSIKKCLYNFVLITPYYSEKDFIGKKQITQTAKKVYNHKDLIRYIQAINNRFGLPSGSTS